MDTISNMKAFVAVARCGSFIAAARELRVAASVVTKRVDQLEWRVGSRLFERSTRRIVLTAAGQQLLPEAQRLAHDVDDVLARLRETPRQLAGPLRVKVPTHLTAFYLADVLGRFQRLHPSITMEVIVLDRPVDPVHEGFDVALSMFATSFAGVIEIDLCAVPRLLVAAPDYLAGREAPQHPTQLLQHLIVNFQPLGTTWTFEGNAGPIAVTVAPHMSSNDGYLLARAAVHGNGITLLSSYLVLPALREGTLVPLLPEFPVPSLWVRALVPAVRMPTARVQALIEHLRQAFSPEPPWERDTRTRMQP
jgi:DNA-binding transcriptional LysR family regulator